MTTRNDSTLLPAGTQFAFHRFSAATLGTFNLDYRDPLLFQDFRRAAEKWMDEPGKRVGSVQQPWISYLTRIADADPLPAAIVVLSVAWLASCLVDRHQRPPLVYRPSSTGGFGPLLRYELLSQAMRALAAALFILSARQGATRWTITSAIVYVFVLGLVKAVVGTRWRHIILRQINIVSCLVLLVVLLAHWLPCIEIAAKCSVRDPLAGATLTLLLSLLVASATPREWTAPALPKNILPGSKQDSLLARPPAPEETCSWLSYYWTYGWLTPTIMKGSRSSLVKEQLPALPWYDDPHLMFAKVRAARKWGGNTFWTTVRLVHLELILMTFWICTAYVLELVPPFALYQLLAHLDNPHESVYNPWVWLALIFLGPVVASITFQQYVFTSTRTIIRIKSALTQELYHMAMGSMELEHEEDHTGDGAPKDTKDPKENGQTTTTTTTGRLANLMASDIEAIYSGRDIILMGIAAPISVTLALVGLYKIVGWPALVGAAILLVSSVCTIYTTQLTVPIQAKIRRAQDSRISLVSEYLALVRAVKYFAWERFAIGKVQDARGVEQGHLWTYTLLNSLAGVINHSFPYLAMLSILGIRVLVQGKPLPSSVAFTTVSLVQSIRATLSMTAWLSKRVTSAIVAFRRLDKYFELSRPLQVYPVGPPRIRGGTFARNTTATFKLRDINVDFVEGGLNVVTGQSGSGKTTLLLSLLGETINEAGHVTRPRDVGYASQTAWLQSGNIRDNIVCFEPFEPARYHRIIECCCLEPDLAQLPKGDQTVVGENGTSLSGGQRARVALARALYSKAPLVLLDDVFSALDTKTAARMWELCFCGDLLQGRTALLVTQVPWIAAQADLEVVLENGLVKETKQNLGVVRRPVSVATALATNEPASLDSEATGNGGTTLDVSESATMDVVDQEMGTQGASRMKFRQYMTYFGSPMFPVAALVLSLVGNATWMGAGLWLALWTRAYDNEEIVKVGYYAGIYAAILFGEIIVDNVSYIMFRFGGWKAARALHMKLIRSVMGAPLSWHSATPVGRVVNRFARDMGVIDEALSTKLYFVVSGVLALVFRLGAISSILPIFIVPSAATCVAGIIIGEMYTRTGVILRRLESSTQSPVFSQFADTLAGLAVIRARENMPGHLADTLAERFVLWSTTAEALYNANRWVSVRIDFIASLVSLGAGIIALVKSSTTASGLVAFSLVNATGLSENILGLVRDLNELEVELQSFDRVEEYLTLEPEEKAAEPPLEDGDTGADAGYDIPPGWPTKGEIEFRDVSVGYDPGEPDILSGINLKLRSGERVAVVGRTGSGKSTLVLSLLRFTHITSGKILYDGVDITKVPRRRLRQALTIIPQEPVLFSGTVESNLDPSGQVPRETLQRVIDLTKAIASFQFRRETDDEGAIAMEGDTSPTPSDEESASVRGLALSTPVTSKGENFSHGQRQVLSLCRALVRKSKLMLLDEATASMDYETDKAIQEVLGREVLESPDDRTLVTIAHRLRTIVDYDTVVVMGDGKILEIGSPAELYKAQGQFYQMVTHGGEADELRDLWESRTEQK